MSSQFTMVDSPLGVLPQAAIAERKVWRLFVCSQRAFEPGYHVGDIYYTEQAARSAAEAYIGGLAQGATCTWFGKDNDAYTDGHNFVHLVTDRLVGCAETLVCRVRVVSLPDEYTRPDEEDGWVLSEEEYFDQFRHSATAERRRLCQEHGSLREAARAQMAHDQQFLDNFGVTWEYRGVRAACEVRIPANTVPDSWVCVPIWSAGLWGISARYDGQDDKYLHDVGVEELDNLKHMLLALGLAPERVDAAIAQVDWEV